METIVLKARHLLCAVTVLAICGCTGTADVARDEQRLADLILSGGQIVTLDDQNPGGTAVAVRDGIVIAVGSKEEVHSLQGENTLLVDLAGHTLVPGFIDGHSHFSMAVNSATWANLSGAPVGEVSNITDIVAELKAQAGRNQAKPGDWIVGYGYDQDTLEEGRHVTRDDLDSAFPHNPVVMIHVSFHGAVLNSRSFEAINYHANTVTPEGGIIVRRDDGNEPLGLLMETAWFPVMQAMPSPDAAARSKNLQLAQSLYAANGITTMQDGFVDMVGFSQYKEAAANGEFYLDLVALGSPEDLGRFAAEKAQYGDYNGRLKLGGIKIIGDGSPQGKTAFFTKPYLTGGPGGEQDWRGEPIIGDQAMDGLLKAIYSAGLRPFVHANADAEIDVLINAHKNNIELAGEDSRTVIIHSQFVRQDQLEGYAKYGMVPSFFSNHAFYWGDVHVENLGQERAFFLSPMKSASELGIHHTNHSDYIVTPLDPMFMLWSAVNRVSRSGRVIGPGERISPEQALRAMTLEGAWQYEEEHSKGSISPGKLADFVVLDANPLTVAPMSIRDISILATYKEGQLVFSSDPGSQ
jgi:predicted amidohydrolase YtcJ